MDVRRIALAGAACALAMIVMGSGAAAAESKGKPALDEKAMMEAYMKAATPGPVHAEMAKLVGSWKLEVTSWPAPGAPPATSAATAEFKLMLGGRYLQQIVHGDMGGMPFEGMGIEGFDNVSQERFGLWIDTMSTGAMMVRGKCAAGEKVCTYYGSMNDPITGKSQKVREVLTKIDDRTFRFEMHGPDPAGKEFKAMEIVYTKQ